MAEMAQQRAKCPVCRREVTVTRAGKLRHHNDPTRRDPGLSRFGVLCRGAGQRPDEIYAEKEVGDV